MLLLTNQCNIKSAHSSPVPVEYINPICLCYVDMGMAVTVLYILPNTALGRAVLTGAAENKVSLHVGQGGSW